jgi:hypothetical protein
MLLQLYDAKGAWLAGNDLAGQRWTDALGKTPPDGHSNIHLQGKRWRVYVQRTPARASPFWPAQRDTASAYIARATVLLGQVFERFYRGPGAANGGSGLGLAIVREVARRHAARVWLENRPDGGLAASLWLRNTPPVGTPVTAPTPTCKN